ncbi:MAG: PAS domain S-box-containing protein, partial [Cyanobium sp.]
FGLVESDVGQSLIGIPTTIPLPSLREALLAVIRGEKRSTIEATSDEISLLVQVMPYLNLEGRCLGAIITLTDVSEQVALRRAAEASLREFTSLAEGLEQAVWKRDHTMEQILYISHQIEELTGWSPAEHLQNSDLFDGAILAADRAVVAAARHAGGSGWSVTYRLTRRDGQERTLKEVGRIVEENDDQYFVGTLSDVTDDPLL